MLGNLHNDIDRLMKARDALAGAAFTIETVAHLGGLETSLLSHAEKLRDLCAEMDRRVIELSPDD